MQLFWGTSYVQASGSLAVLSVGFFSSAAAGRNRETISALGYTRFVSYANGLAFIVNIVLNIILIPEYGYLGAAYASAVSFLLLNIFVYIILRFKFEITPFSTYSRRTFIALPLTLLPPVYYISKLSIYPQWSVPLILLCTAALTIGVVMITSCLEPDDRIVVEFLDSKLPFSFDLIYRWIPKE
jgi:O-antigen/teichoic acid export membrane protein